jgi:hypothetical protein
VVLTWGDVQLRAERLVYDPTRFFYGEAFGNVVLRRGDEELRGSTFILNGQEGLFVAEDAVLASPPLYIRGRTVTRTPYAIRAADARVGIGALGDGRGELQFRVGELLATTPTGRPGRLMLRNAGVYLFGTRLFTIRRATIKLTGSRRRRRSTQALVGSGAVPPVRARVSRISGSLFGVSVPLTLGENLAARTDIDLSTRRGVQYGATVRRDLISGGGGDGGRRRGLGSVTPGGIDPSVAGLSPIRQVLKARPLPPPPDPVLDFESILPLRDPLAEPTGDLGRDMYAELNVSGPREFGSRRQGPLVLTRMPELNLIARFPLGGGGAATPDPEISTNAADRAALRRPRLFASAQGTAGQYSEERLQVSRDGGGPSRHVRESRFGGAATLGLQPFLLGDSRTLARADTTYTSYAYGSGRRYHYLETALSVAHVFAYRTSLGASYIVRAVGGATPFYWDQVDTRSEAQVRGQITLAPRNKYTLAGVGRYDVSQRRLFDFEIAFAMRGQNIEPRFSYRRLNGQFGFNLALPGISF